MTLSNSKDFELDVAEYVEEAFERCGLEVRTGYDLKTAKRSLNLLLADWANRGLNQWTIKQVSLPLVKGISDYPAGILNIIVGTVNAFIEGENITGVTSGATASITSATTATVFAITIPSGTFVAGETIVGETSGASTTVTSAVDFSNVRSNIDILSVVVRRDGTDFALSRLSRDDYINIPNKTTQSRPNQFFLDRQVTPILRIWPTPENDTDVIFYNALTRMDDADTFINNMDMPFRFYPCLAAGLAYYLALKRAPNRVQMLKAVYEEEFERAATEDRDRSSFNVAPSHLYRVG